VERAVASTSSTEARAAALPARLLAGRVVGAHGLRGRLRIRCDEGGAEGLLEAEHVFLGDREQGARRYEIREARPGRRGEVRLELGEIADRSAADALRGACVWIEPMELAELPAGEYWAFQLIGCEVEDATGRRLGRVREIRSTGAQDLLVVDGAGGAEHLIPAVQSWWREVDLAGRRIVVELPPGLLEPARHRSG
jgi:16S rRNA processing protein RimM